MRKVKRLMGLALAAAASAAAATELRNVRTDAAYFNYSRYDQVVGGKQVSLYVNIEPVWPPTDPARITYSGTECTIDSCFDFYGYQYCYCSFFPGGPWVQFNGSGQLPEGAFSVSPQGAGRLALDVTELTGGNLQGPCDRLDVTWTPNGQWHRQQDMKLLYESPTEVSQGVGRDEDWSASVAGSVCGIAVPENPATPGSVQKSHWVTLVRNPKP